MELTYEQFLHKLGIPDTSLVQLIYTMYLEIVSEQHIGDQNNERDHKTCNRI